MPIDLLPIANMAGQGINALAQGKMNVAMMAYNQAMYLKQRKDAIADWHMQNEYNSPAAQMRRLSEAGLNPNLVYGNGAKSEAGSVRSSDSKSWQPQVPQVDPSSAIMSYYDAQLRQAQLDNLKVQKTLMEEEVKNKVENRNLMVANTALRASQRDLTDTNLQLKGVDLNYAVELKEMSLESLRASVAKTMQDTEKSKAETAYRLSENERRSIQVSQGVRESVQRILKMRADVLRTEAQTTNEYFRKDLLINQAIRLERLMNSDELRRQLLGEELRLKSATPEYYEKKIGDIVSNLIEGGFAPGTKLNPKQFNRNTKTEFQRIQIERKRGTWER